MPNEEFLDGKGNTSDAQGRPWEEIFEHKVLRRLEFETFLDHAGEYNDDTKAADPLEPNPFPPQPKTINTSDKQSLGEFFDRHRRGPYKK